MAKLDSQRVDGLSTETSQVKDFSTECKELLQAEQESDLDLDLTPWSLIYWKGFSMVIF